MPKVTIDGQVYQVEPGRTIIQVADEVGVQIPRYCYHPDIGIEGSCRMCLVEVEKAPKLMPSCATPVADGMVVRTQTQRVHEAVRYALEFLLLHHPIDCPVCDQSGECWLQDYYMAHAAHESRFPLGQKTRRKKAFNLGPLVKLDQERCILCTRCVRFTRNVTKTNEIQVFNRGHRAEIGIYKDAPLENPYSMNVVDVCPVGALTSDDFRFKVRSWFLKGTPSVCAGCSTGCNLRIDHSARATGGGVPGVSATDGQIYRTVGRRNPDVNKSWLCDEGRLSFHSLERHPRLIRPPKDWDAVFPEIHERFEAIRQEFGDRGLAGLGSPMNTNEALFLLKRYFRVNAAFGSGGEDTTYQDLEDSLLRRKDKHPNTRGALDLGLEPDGLSKLLEKAGRGELKGVWISFHPQLVGDAGPEIEDRLSRLIAAVSFSVVTTTHDLPWARNASLVLPMAAWSEERGTYTNYAGRVQLVARAVAPPGWAKPLHSILRGVLAVAGVQVSNDPETIFDWLAHETPAYGSLDYATIGLLGAMTSPVAEEVAP